MAKKKKLKCSKCKFEWQYGFWHWLLNAPAEISFNKWLENIKNCPKCGTTTQLLKGED